MIAAAHLPARLSPGLVRRALRYVGRRLWAPWALAGVTSCGRGARVAGRPVVENQGTITIGRNFALAARVARGELFAGPGGVLAIGDDVFVNSGTILSASLRVEIGDGCQLGPYCILLDNDFHAPGRPDADARMAPIVLGRGVWLASRVTVLRGVTIGDGAVVGAGAVVTRDVPAGAIVAGVPARVIGWTPGHGPA